MEVFYDVGIHVREGIKEIVLDPRRSCAGAIVSHAHADHMASGALMTPQTLEIMKVRRKASDGISLSYGKKAEYSGFPIVLKDAGHVFGSAMVRIEDLLYTGDLNPEGGPTCGNCQPEECNTLIIEATYGKPEFQFGPKSEIAQDMLAWVETQLEKGPVAIGGYEFGKAQELIALANSLDEDVVTTDSIANIADVYRKYGVPLRYRRYSELTEEEKKDSHIFIVTKSMLKHPISDEIRYLRSIGGRTCYVSGWCAIYYFGRSYDIDAQFPLSDHADFKSLISFVQDCKPKEVLTCHGQSKVLAKEIKRRLGIEARAIK